MALWDVPGAIAALPSDKRLAAIIGQMMDRPVTVPPQGGLLIIDGVPQTVVTYASDGTAQTQPSS